MHSRRQFFWLVVLLATPASAAAGLYSPDEGSYFNIDEHRYAQALAYDDFRVALSRLSELNVPNSAARLEVEKRIEKRMTKGANALPVEELAGLTHDLMRLGRTDEALNILQPIARDRSRMGFLVLAHLAEAHRARSEWDEAYDQEYSAVRDYPFPKSFPQLSKEQLDWYRRVESEYYLPLLLHRKASARQKRPAVQDTLDPLFPSAKHGQPAPMGERTAVQFLAEDGKYEAGTIGAGEKAKLPPDAIAIVQQLILWDPSDNRLLWQLAELYNAEGNLGAARGLFDLCVDARKYSQPQLMEHRRIVLDALEARAAADRQAEEEAKARERRQDFLVVGIGGAVVLLLGYWQLREWRRRLQAARVRNG
jgi:tetratricopeptide (TPR) repeat protein